ncbi:phage head closure protein (plasmid) [Azospirillum sp. HJ39]|uniref:phage head closure protein n=1 Tax=Azospirillum sp. HJ39 TaxID=3159496 RepID=UPI003558288C
MIRMGELDQRVTIQAETETPDGRGGYTKGWSAVATVWARVRPLSGRERQNAQQTEASVSYGVVIRRRTDVTTACRLIWNGKVMNIRFVGEAGTRDPWLSLECEAGVPV